MIDCEENADYLHQEKMDNMTEYEAQTRMILLDQKGTKALLRWTGHLGELEALIGRLVRDADAEPVFHFNGARGYTRLYPHEFKYASKRYFVLPSNGKILGWIEVVGDEKDSDDEDTNQD